MSGVEQLSQHLGQFTGRFVDSQRACHLLGFDGRDRLHSLYAFVEAQGVPRHRAGRRLRFWDFDLRDALLGRLAARRRRAVAQRAGHGSDHLLSGHAKQAHLNSSVHTAGAHSAGEGA